MTDLRVGAESRTSVDPAPAITVVRDRHEVPARSAAHRRSTTSETSAVSNEKPGFGRAVVLGTVLGFVGTFLVYGGMTLALGVELGPAIGIGLFTAFWGGPGFGGMMGAVLHYNRNEA